MQGQFVVTMIWCPLVGGEEGQNGSDVGAGRNGKIVNRSGDGLVSSLAFGEVRLV